MSIKNLLGKVYHPVLHKIRKSYFYNRKLIKTVIEKSISSEKRKNRIYIDISELHFRDLGTGISRVTKQITSHLIEKFSDQYDIIKIYNYKFEGYFDCQTDKSISFISGDIFFGLENGLKRYTKYYENLRKHGIKIIFYLHDLIPFRYPQYCCHDPKRDFKIFLNNIIKYDKIICNSKTTMDDLRKYISSPFVKSNKNLVTAYSLLGTNFPESYIHPQLKKYSGDSINFLMVSTVEPRKKYDQAIKAFDILWKRNIPVTLTIVGRRGWLAKQIFKQIETNKQFNKKLIWLNSGISDEELAKEYEKCDCVLFASAVEGFGLAVTEGAYFKRPLLLRDIPAFREIAGDNAFYFDSLKPEVLAAKIEEWIDLYKQDKNPDSTNIKLRTWEECSAEVYHHLVTGE